MLVDPLEPVHHDRRRSSEHHHRICLVELVDRDRRIEVRARKETEEATTVAVDGRPVDEGEPRRRVERPAKPSERLGALPRDEHRVAACRLGVRSTVVKPLGLPERRDRSVDDHREERAGERAEHQPPESRCDA